MDDQNQNPAADQNTGWTPPVSTPEPTSAPAGGEQPAQDPAAPPVEVPAADPNAGQVPAGGNTGDQGGNQEETPAA